MKFLGRLLCWAGLHGSQKLYLGLGEPSIRCTRPNCAKIDSASTT